MLKVSANPTDLSPIIPSEFTLSIISCSQNILFHTAFLNLRTTFKFAASNYTTITEGDVII